MLWTRYQVHRAPYCKTRHLLLRDESRGFQMLREKLENSSKIPGVQSRIFLVLRYCTYFWGHIWPQRLRGKEKRACGRVQGLSDPSLRRENHQPRICSSLLFEMYYASCPRLWDLGIIYTPIEPVDKSPVVISRGSVNIARNYSENMSAFYIVCTVCLC